MPQEVPCSALQCLAVTLLLNSWTNTFAEDVNCSLASVSPQSLSLSLSLLPLQDLASTLEKRWAVLYTMPYYLPFSTPFLLLISRLKLEIIESEDIKFEGTTRIVWSNLSRQSKV